MRTSFTPRSVDFRAEREADWSELENLASRGLKRGLGVLSADELHRLPVLYRSALSSLSVARKTALDRELLKYLEALAVRGYLAVYGSRRPTRAPVSAFLLRLFPTALCDLRSEFLVAALVFLLGVVTAWALVASDTGWFFAFVDEGLAGGRTPDATTKFLRDTLYGGEEALLSFASFLFTHNAQIGMLAFALGFVAGVPTVVLLFQNGLMLGAFLALFSSRGLLVPALGWLLPHGVPEIAAVLFCGAAGLSLGRAVVFPGARTVRDAFVQAGRRASLVVMGSIALFAVAGVIEGLFRQAVLDDRVRFALAVFNGVWLTVWIFLPRRRTDEVSS